MWPQRGEALSRTVEAEQVVADLYAEALRLWAPHAVAAVLPEPLVAAVPDPGGMSGAQGAWDMISGLVADGLALLWALTYVEACEALDIDLPDLDSSSVGGVPPHGVAVGIVGRCTGRGGDAVREVFDRIRGAARTRDALRDFVTRQRENLARIPGIIADILTSVLAGDQADVDGDASPPAVPTPGELADRAKDVLDPAGPEFRDVARRKGYDAAGAMNDAIIEAARGSDEELEKCWIATLDELTRPSHWAADGLRVPLEGHFTIGGEQMWCPGDESVNIREWANCRCRVGILAPDEPLPDEVDRHTERLDGRDSTARNRNGRTQQEEIDRRRDNGNIRARDTADGVGRVAASNWTASSEQEQDMDVETFLTFSGYIGKLGVPTSDREILAADIDLTMREFPHPMAWQKQASGGHMDSFTVGVVEEARVDGDRVWASGYFLNSPEAVEAADQVKHRVSAPSLDLATAEYIFTDENGKEIEGDLFDWWEENGEPYTYFTKAEQTGFTLVQTPAFDGIDITLGERETRDLAVVAAIVASVDEPRVKMYDPSLFENPKLGRATAPTMDNTTGRIYGHLAEWGHTIRGGREVTPRNRNGYLNFHTSQVQLDDGRQLSVGRLTVQGGHAATTAGVTVATARAHYDNVCTAFALVRVGEDEHGIWFSGVPAPGVSPEVLQMGMTAPLSGDWRNCAGVGLDMIGAHAVNSPGFPIYSVVTGPDGRELALVASLGPSRRSASTSGGFVLDVETLRDVITEVVDALDQRNAKRQAEFTQQERAAAVLSRAREVVGDPPAEPTTAERLAALLERA